MSSYTAQSREPGRAPVPMDARQDIWWVQPLLTVIVLGGFGLYATLRAFENNYFHYPWGAGWEPHTAAYLSPFYSPYLPVKLSLGTWTISPALYILIFPLSFRMTCYYYRKAYYRAFFWDPPACAVAEPRADARMRYTGERAFPFIAQNLHRYAFYFAAIFIVILWYDAIHSFIWRDTPNGPAHFGMGLGSVFFLVNVILLSLYTFSCHSWRHLIGGSVDCYSCSALSKTRYGIWQKVSFLNSLHALYAWCSLFSVALTDLYVRLISSGAFADPRFF